MPAQQPKVQSEWQKIYNREEVRVVRQSAKQFRSLCKDYSVPFDSSFLSSRAHGEEDGSPASSSCSSDASGEYDDPGEEIQGISKMMQLLDAVEIDERVKTLTDMSNSLNESAANANNELKELEGIEKASAEDASELVIDEELLKFRVDEMPAIQALRRCVETTPALREESARRLKELQELPLLLGQQADDELDPDDAAGDHDPEVLGIRSEVVTKLARLGKLPVDADRDLRLVLEAQRQEIKAIAQRIDEGEKKVHLQNATLEYLDGTVRTSIVDGQLLDGAIRMAQEVRDRIFKLKRHEANQAFLAALATRNAPSEVEVEDCMEECHRLRGENNTTDERVQRMLTAVAQRRQQDARNPHREQSASPRPHSRALADDEDDAFTPRVAPRRRGALQDAGALETAPTLEVSHEGAAEMHAKLKKEVAALEHAIKDADRRSDSIEAVLRNGEQSAKVMEETKTLFLEQLARDKASLLEAFGIVSEDKEANNGESSSEHSDEEILDETGLARRIQSLADEEQFLRMELEIAESAFDEELLSEPGSDGAASVASQESTLINPEDQTFRDVRHLAFRVQQEVQQKVNEREKVLALDLEHASDDEDNIEVSSEEGEERPLTPKSAMQFLQSATHPEMSELLELQETNKMLLGKIQHIQNGIHETRVISGALNLHAGESSNLDPGMKAEAQRKMRELDALRKRWWSERQDPQTTVRRALATQDLDIDSQQPDAPPKTAQASLFQRIQASMTMP